MKSYRPENDGCDPGNLVYRLICFSILAMPLAAVLEHKSEQFATFLRIFVPY